MSADAAVRKYQNVAYAVASRFFLPGADRDDVRQEALIALWRGLASYDGRGNETSFLAMCVHRHLVTCLKQAQALKHQPLNGAARHEVLALVAVNTLDVVEAREQLAAVMTAHRELSDMERAALRLVVNGGEYVHDKSVDNAVQRARRKLRAAA